MMALSSSIQAQTRLMEKIQESVAQNSSDKKKKFDNNLHESTKLLILNASSRNGEVTPIKPSLQCETFFKKKSISQTKQYLIESLADKGCIVEIETGLVTALVNGQLLRDREDTPSNFSIFLVPIRKPLSSSSFKSGMILGLKYLYSKWDDKDMKDVVKQGVACPLSIEEMIHQINNFAHLCAFFFTEASFAIRLIIVLNDRIKSHLNVLESAQYRDKRFATKFCFALDTRFFSLDGLMQEGERQRESVNDQLLKFDTLLNSVLIEQFHQTLPSTMRLVDEVNPHSGTGSSFGSLKEPDKKKQKKLEDTEERKVDNKKPFNE